MRLFLIGWMVGEKIDGKPKSTKNERNLICVCACGMHSVRGAASCKASLIFLGRSVTYTRFLIFFEFDPFLFFRSSFDPSSPCDLKKSIE